MPETIYDVCVIGSGAAGGVVTKQLCEAGAKTILLEAGQEVKLTQLRSHCWPYELKFRGLRAEKQALFYPPDIEDTVRYEDCDDVHADRIRVLGGRTMHWNADVFRYAPIDFMERSFRGIEEDWPVTYDELEPYYDQAEQMMGVFGQDDHLPILPAGKNYLPPPPFRCSDDLVKRVCKPMGIQVIPTRRAVLTRPMNGHPACHYCGHCMDGCDVGAIFTIPGRVLPLAKKTGNLTIRQNALARELLVGDEGRVRAVSIVDRMTREEEEIRAAVFVVCCSTFETARLLLNSRSSRYTTGLANSSGAVGRYLHGHFYDTTLMYIDQLQGRAATNQDGALDHAYIPRFNANSVAHTFGVQLNLADHMFPYQARKLPGYGDQFKQQVRHMQSGLLSLSGYGKVMANPENRMTVDRNKVDSFGIPIPVIHFKFGAEDQATFRTLDNMLTDICDRLKGPSFGQKAPVGWASHEVGTVRMGQNPRTSVLNGYCQSYDVKNLFVTDGSCFTTSSEKNPTLTIVALSMRAADHITELRKKREL